MPRKAESLARVVKAEMQSQEIGVYQLADKSGVRANMIYAWFDGRDMQVSNVEKILAALGLTVCKTN